MLLQGHNHTRILARAVRRHDDVDIDAVNSMKRDGARD
jgi:hypothetical protein